MILKYYLIVTYNIYSIVNLLATIFKIFNILVENKLYLF